MRSALQFRDVLDAAVPAFIIYVTTLDDRRYTRIYPWIVPSQLAFTWIGRRSLRLGLKLKPELAIRFPGLTVLDASNHEQGDHHWNDLRSDRCGRRRIDEHYRVRAHQVGYLLDPCHPGKWGCMSRVW